MKHRNTLLAIAAIFLTSCGTLSKNEVSVEVDDVIIVGDAKTPVNTKAPVDVENPVDSAAPIESKPITEIKPPKSGVKTIGQIEYVDILPQGIRQKARIDTGAETSSLSAVEIQPFERDGKSWVKFNVIHRVTGEVTEFAKPLERTALIKRHGAENVERPVVMLTLAIGSIEQDIEVSLTDRSKFEFPVLIGRNFLDGNIAVDVSTKFLMLDK